MLVVVGLVRSGWGGAIWGFALVILVCGLVLDARFGLSWGLFLGDFRVDVCWLIWLC